MEELYNKSIQAIKEYDRIPSKKEWNSIAKKYGFLNTYSLNHISGKNFVDLCIEVRKRNKE